MNKEVIDIHIHFGAPDDQESGCYWSKEFEKTVAYIAMLLVTKSLLKRVDIQRIKKHLLGVINGSKKVRRSVVLAMDQVYDENGVAHPEWTHIYVPNRYVSNLSESYDRVLFGASVHPYRVDWSEELDYCLEHKATICKWIPSSQMIDPTNKKCIPFYKKIAEYHLPLLCHTGPEYAIPTSNDDYNEYNNPKYLRYALDQGVTVIIAHCAMPYFGILDYDYQNDFKEFFKLFNEADKNKWQLYADISACCSPFRIQYIEEIKKRLDIITSERLIFGSDYPIPLSELCYNKSTSFLSWLKFVFKVSLMKNPLDKNYHLIKGMGFDECIFTNADKLFSSIQY